MATLSDQPRAVRLLSLGALLTLLAVATLASDGQARAQSYDSPIAQRALRDVGTYQGDCWPWVRKVVQDATGKTMGFGYRSGYFQGGAVEVSMAEARAGDVLQISDDNNSDPGAYYPGLHTVIILDNLGGGIFNAIDSNQNWDGVVNLRPNYAPYARAASLGLDVHIYRFETDGTTGSAEPQPTPAAEPTPPEGSKAARVFTDDGACLRLRSAPTANSTILTCLADRSRVWITGSGVAADGYTWVPVTTLAGSGYMAMEYLQLDASEEPSAALGPTQTPAPAATPAPSPTVDPANMRYRVGVPGVISGADGP